MTSFAKYDQLLNYGHANVATFRKCENIDFTIKLKRYNGDNPVTTNIFGRTDWYFKIYPVK